MSQNGFPTCLSARRYRQSLYSYAGPRARQYALLPKRLVQVTVPFPGEPGTGPRIVTTSIMVAVRPSESCGGGGDSQIAQGSGGDHGKAKANEEQ